VTSRLLQELPRAAAPRKLNVAYAFDGLLVGTIGPVFLAIWRTKPTPELFEIQRRELTSAVARDPGKVAFLCVVESAADPPDQAVRDASAAMISSLGKQLAACACVIEGKGFRAVVTRTVLAGMGLVARHAAPNRFFESVPVASAWLGERLGRDSEPGLAEKVELARECLDAAPPARR
jgi:hypothetical protein